MAAETGFLNRSVTIGATTYSYVVYVPRDWTADRAWPVILFLHGAGERGSDGLHQTIVGVGNAVRWHPERFPAVIVFPQCPTDQRWIGEPLDAAIAALDRTTKEFHGDADRTYLTGLSMGGYGTWHAAMAYPDRFAAIVPVCGGILKPTTAESVRQSPITAGTADPYEATAERVQKLPIWVFHGTDDQTIPVTESRHMVDDLRKLGADVRYTEYPGVGHDSWTRAYDELQLSTWMLNQRRGRSTKVNEPSETIIVVRNGEIIRSQSRGMADLENDVAATADTHYRLASVTKQFTAAAIQTLAKDGKVSLDDPVRKWLPSLPAYADAITLRHLLTHSSGLIDYEDVMAADTKAQLHDLDVLHLLETQTKTYFAPGTSYRYSNSGYALLALIVEKASGQTFANFLHDRIFMPLGMRTTVAHQDGIDTVFDRAYGYSRAANGWTRTDQSLTSAVLGDGGIYTSANELVNWLRALDNGQFSEAAVPRVGTDKPGAKYGYGFFIGEHNGKHAVWHTGETIGFRNAVVRLPDQKLSVVVLTNRDEGEPLETAWRIADSIN
jgi:CubicO group peptidase (beta-lactamase class C family)/predicted esterase